MKLIYLNFNDEKCNSNMDYYEVKTIKDLNNIRKLDDDFIMFFKNTSSIDNVNFDEIINFMKEKNINLYALMPYTSNNKKGLKIKKSSIINIEDGSFNLYFDTYIIKKELLNNYKFDNNFERFLILDLLDKEKIYYQSTEYKIIKDEDILIDKNIFNKHNDIDWYLSDLKLLIEKVKGKDLDYQNMLLNYYLAKLFHNIRQIESSILDSKQLIEFKNLSHEFLSNIDDKLLNVSNITKNISVPKNIIYYLYNLKYKNNIKYTLNDEYINYNGNITKLDSNPIVIKAINVIDDYYEFYCTYDYISSLVSKPILFINDKEIEYQDNKIYAGTKIFGEIYYNDFSFNFKVKIDSVNKIYFKTINNEMIKMTFPLNSSRLLEKYSKSYWVGGNKILYYSKKSIVFKDAIKMNKLKKELKFLLQILKRNKFSSKSLYVVLLRLIHFITKPYYSKKNIWITYDKLFKSGDCGEYFFRYVSDNTKENIYYILNKDAKYYSTLKKKYKRILSFNSFKCKLISSHAKIVFLTDQSAMAFCSYNKFQADLCKNIFNADNYHIQHGLTIQDLRHVQNRLTDNIKRYYLASKFEEKNLLNEEYGFKKDELVLTGIPRFDGLHDNKEKIILLTPTWRVNLAMNSQSGKIRDYNSNFKKSKYFELYNNLINNEELLNNLKKYNYKLRFIIHPTLINNIDDYDKNDYVEIYPANLIDYETELRNASLMITDYSGVQYDFAYMKKPIIYYHPKELPPSYGSGTMDYEKNGFGPIISNEKDLIAAITKVLKVDCKNDTKYINRIKTFFEYDDFNSCKRIYEDLKKHGKTKKN